MRSWRVEAVACRSHPAPTALHTDALIFCFQGSEKGLVFYPSINKGMGEIISEVIRKSFVGMHKPACYFLVKVQ